MDLERIFPERLFDFILMRRSSSAAAVSSRYKKIKEAFGTELWLSGPSPVWETDDGVVYLGDIFGAEASGYVDGHYVGIEFHENAVRVFRNRNSSIGIYYSVFEDGSQYVFGDFLRGRRFLAAEHRLSEDGLAQENLLNTGLISGGLTSTKEIKQLPFSYQLLLSRQGAELKPEEVLLFSEPQTAKDFFELIRERFSLWFKHCRFSSVALSGGMDSRLLMSVLSGMFEDSPETSSEKRIQLVARLHPHLSDTQDRDVISAQKVASALGYPLSIQYAVDRPSAYLSQEPPMRGPMLSGFLGGEYLGGELVVLTSQGESLAEKMRMLAETFSCDFYGGAWGLLFLHHNLTLSPFWDSYVFQALLRYPEEKIVGYRLYRELYDFFPSKLKDIPLNSLAFENHWPEMDFCEDGVEPKSLAVGSPTSRAGIFEVLKA